MNKTIALLIAIFILLMSCAEKETPDQYLEKVLSNLKQIESARYLSTRESWNPGDTVASYIVNILVKEYNNPSDTTIGASWVVLDGNDTMQLKHEYDGKMKAVVYEDAKGILIDSFNVRKLPFRPIIPPFFNYTKNILQYALTTKDSIHVEQKDEANILYVKLTIFEDTQVEFFGEAHHMPKPPFDMGDPTSRYELWIDTKKGLPYKVRREMSHNISVNTVRSPVFNTLNIKDFNVSDYFPAGYEIRYYGEAPARQETKDLTGSKAADWTLLDTKGNNIRLNDMKSKVVMLQFTSVSCGPCRASVPFLKELVKEYNPADFVLLAIECTSKNTHVLDQYQKRCGFDYPFLITTNEVLKNYAIHAFPVFVILDRDRVIRKIIRGYSKGTVDDRIRDTINELI